MTNLKRLLKIKHIFIALLVYLLNNNQSYAELSYNILEEKQPSKEQNNTDKKETEKKTPLGSKLNKIKLNIGGLADFQYYYTRQSQPYRQDILPNGLTSSPVMQTNSSIYNNTGNVLNMLGRVDINPEFVRYKPEDQVAKGESNVVIKVGVKISQPLFKAKYNVDPKMAPKEYIYVDTKFFRFEFGSVESAGARMKVDAEKLASGNGGVFGTWWRYAILPVFNTTGLSGTDLTALNAMSPIYMLHPALPNEAGFTTQRGLIGQQINANMFVNGSYVEPILYGSNMQPYPTQGAYSNKISLYTKRIKGFKFGFSYSPNTIQSGYLTKTINGNTFNYNNTTGGYVKNYISMALDYRKQIDKYGIGIAISATYEHGEATPVKYTYENGYTYAVAILSNSPYYNRHALNAWNVGVQVIWKNFSISYSYGDWGRSLLPKYLVNTVGEYQVSYQGSKSYYHTCGIGANYGPIKIGITYMRSDFAGNKLDAWSIGTDYKMISLRYLRVQPYFEYTGFIFHTQNVELKSGVGQIFTAVKNRGFVLTAGIRVIF